MKKTYEIVGKFCIFCSVWRKSFLLSQPYYIHTWYESTYISSLVMSIWYFHEFIKHQIASTCRRGNFSILDRKRAGILNLCSQNKRRGEMFIQKFQKSESFCLWRWDTSKLSPAVVSRLSVLNWFFLAESFCCWLIIRNLLRTILNDYEYKVLLIMSSEMTKCL